MTAMLTNVGVGMPLVLLGPSVCGRPAARCRMPSEPMTLPEHQAHTYRLMLELTQVQHITLGDGEKQQQHEPLALRRGEFPGMARGQSISVNTT